MTSVESTTENISPSNGTDAESTTQQTTKPLEGEELQQAILTQIEYYFSAQNLPSDVFLLSKMDSDHFVPVSLIAGFTKIKELTSDENVVINAIESSILLELSSDKSKLRLKEERRRNRLILHNLPSETTDQELVDLFKDGGYSPIIKSDVNNCWFVTFETEDTASSALEFIRKQKIHDKSIRARLKSEQLLRNIYNPPEPNPAQFIPQSAVPYVMGYGGNQGQWMPYMWDQNGEQRNFEGKERRYKGKGQRNKEYRKDKKRGGNRKGKGRENKKQQPVQLGPSDFPPLPSTSSTKNAGYSGDFIKYSQIEITDALKSMEPTKPNDIEEFPFISEPHKVMEVSNTVTIESKDLPPSTKPVSLSDRIKQKKVKDDQVKDQHKKNGPSSDSKGQKPQQKTGEKDKKGSWSQVAKTPTQSKESKGGAKSSANKNTKKGKK